LRIIVSPTRRSSDLREHEHHQHVINDARRVRDLLVRLIVAIALTAPALAVSMVSAWQFPGWEWVVGALATPVVWWCAWPFHRSRSEEHTSELQSREN